MHLLNTHSQHTLTMHSLNLPPPKIEIDQEVAAKKAEAEKTFSLVKGEKKLSTDDEL